jgi:Sugar efflux transporter for intercellular exchange
VKQAPLQTVCKVISERSSASIHAPTMIMNWMNTSFWIAYGLARRNPVIVIPNSIGLLLGILQGVLRLAYPASSDSVSSGRHDLIPQDDIDGPGFVDETPSVDVVSSSLSVQSRRSSNGLSAHSHEVI